MSPLVSLSFYKASRHKANLWVVNLFDLGQARFSSALTVLLWILIAGKVLGLDSDESHVPERPGKIRLEATSTTITVSWEPPKNKSVLIRGYTIGWGIGVPDTYTKVLSANEKSFTLTGLEPTNEYVVSVRAFNDRGDGQPGYETIWTRVSTTPKPKLPIQPPVGLSANVLSPLSILLSWTDTSIPARNTVPENRIYSIRYTSNFVSQNPKYKYLNTTKQSILIEDLKPFTQYEFAVRTIKGRKETPWSMSVVNTTHETEPSSPPDDFTAIASRDEDPTLVYLHWQPPRQPNGQITGYVILYTTNKNQPDKSWAVEPVSEDKLTTVLHNLTPDTTYYFKIQVRNKKGYGPLSEPIAFRTLSVSKNPPSYSMILLIASISGIVVLLMIVVSILLYKSRRYSPGTPKSPARKHKGYIAAATSPIGKSKSGKELKPPDLWIHHTDQIELKGLEKGQTNSINGTPLRRNPEEMPLTSREADDPSRKNPTYNDLYYDDVNKSPTRASESSMSYASGSSTVCRNVKPKPITVSIDGQMNGPIIKTGGNLGYEPSTALSRPLYPRTQLNIQRAHVTMDSKDNPVSLHHFYDPVASPPMHMGIAGSSGESTNQITNAPSVSYSSTNGFNVIASPNVNTLSKRPTVPQSLKSFSVPIPPSHNSSKLMISPQFPNPNPSKSKIINGATTVNNLSLSNGSTYFDRPSSQFMVPPARLSLAESVKKEDDVISTYSTEEFNQERANLERVMKDLNALAEADFNMES